MFFNDLFGKNDKIPSPAPIKKPSERTVYLSRESRSLRSWHFSQFMLGLNANKIKQKDIQMSPKISVIIPVYNAVEYLGQCLDTILLQTFQDIEVICVDDGSTDDGLSCLQGYAFLDSRLKVVHQEHAGAGSARNNGLKEAKGEYVICLDSDNFFESDMLEKMLARAEQDKSDIVALPTLFLAFIYS